jgi:hypothetical protein
VCVYIHIHIYIHIYVYIHIHIHIHIYIYDRATATDPLYAATTILCLYDTHVSSSSYVQGYRNRPIISRNDSQRRSLLLKNRSLLLTNHLYRATATDPLYLATTILCSTLPATAFPVYGRAGFSRSLLLIFNTRIGLIYLHTTMSLLLLQEGSQGSLSCLALFHEAGPGGLRRDARFPSGTFGPYADYSSGPMRHVIGPCGRHLDGL